MWGRTVQGRLQRMSLRRCGVVWENNSILCCRSAVILQKSGADRTTTVICVYHSTRCQGPSRTNQDHAKKLPEEGYGVGRRQWRPGAGGEAASYSLLFKMMFALWHPAPSIVIFHNIMASLAPWPSGWPLIKGKKRNPWFILFLQKCSLPFSSV